jgi:hypothetical protein
VSRKEEKTEERTERVRPANPGEHEECKFGRKQTSEDRKTADVDLLASSFRDETFDSELLLVFSEPESRRRLRRVGEEEEAEEGDNEGDNGVDDEEPSAKRKGRTKEKGRKNAKVVSTLAFIWRGT